MEGHEEKLKFFARENSIDASELEQALLHLRQQQSSNNQNWKGGKLLNQQNSYPDFLETADENGEPNPTGENNIGGFQLLDLIITKLKSHMTCKNPRSYWWKFYLSKKILYKICSPA